jgi:transcriptional regulator with XRE-family HTH domain
MNRRLYAPIRARIIPHMTIATRLDKAMHDAKIRSQAELSRRSRVPQPTINRILKGQGKKGPETATLVALANALGVEVKWLQQGVGPQSENQPDAEAPAKIVSVESKSPRFLLHWLSEEETEVLAEFRSMTKENQRLTRLFTRRLKRDRSDGAVDES